jgi:hypothetical protein
MHMLLLFILFHLFCIIHLTFLRGAPYTDHSKTVLLAAHKGSSSQLKGDDAPSEPRTCAVLGLSLPHHAPAATLCAKWFAIKTCK